VIKVGDAHSPMRSLVASLLNRLHRHIHSNYNSAIHFRGEGDRKARTISMGKALELLLRRLEINGANGNNLSCFSLFFKKMKGFLEWREKKYGVRAQSSSSSSSSSSSIARGPVTVKNW